MLCVHGNPTWSYLWRRFLAAAPPGWRVVAPTSSAWAGPSARPAPRRLAERIDDLDRADRGLEITGPVVAVAHDWGGPDRPGLGAAAPRPAGRGGADQHRRAPADRDRRATGADPAGPFGGAPATWCASGRRPSSAAPRRCPGPPCPATVRDGARRAVRTGRAGDGAVGDFVADIPLEPDHPSRVALDRVADGLAELRDVPALLLWGARDPVFSERYLHDLPERLPQADVQRYAAGLPPGHRGRPRDRRRRLALGRGSAGGHDGDPAGSATAAPDAAPPGLRRRGTADLLGRAQRPRPPTVVAAVAICARRPPVISFAELEQRVADLAAGLAEAGVRPGPPGGPAGPAGIDLTVAVYACWRAGAVIVVADAGLGLRGLGAALRSAGPDHLIGIPPACWPPRARRAGPADPGRLHAGRGAATAGRRPLAELHPTRAATGQADAASRPRRRGRGAVHLRGHRPGQGRGLPPGQLPAQIDLVRAATADLTRRTGWSPPSPRSRCTGRRSASPRRCRTWTSPRPAR